MATETPIHLELANIDSWVGDRVLVTGSLPPDARDIDLVARKVEVSSIASELMDHGFANKEHQWVRFVACDVEPIDLVPAESWNLPEAEEQNLFADAIPIEGCSRLVRPAPHHVLLILARQIAHGEDRLTAKRRARLAQALEEDPGAWSVARGRAGAWRVPTALEALRIHHENGQPIGPDVKRIARTDLEGSDRRGLRPRVSGVLRQRRHESRRMIAFSGIDGSGKSTQIKHLERALATLGIETETVWTRLVWTTLYDNRALLVIAAPFKAILGFFDRFKSAHIPPETEPVLEDPNLVSDGRDPAREFRERSLLVTRVWTTVIALIHARTQRRAVHRALRRGRQVVICDRYLLDAAVHLRFRYGTGTRLRPQITFMRRLMPTPTRAYYLDVSPATALARKAEEYTRAHLERHVALYRELYPTLGVIRVNGERSEEELCAEIAQDVWMSLNP